jgi:small subunit ribosomal protein S6e
LRIVKKGEQDIQGLTDVQVANRLGPKTRNNIIKTFGLDAKKDDVRKYVVRREIKRKDKTFYKSPRIQRLVTESRLRRKHQNRKIRFATQKKTRESLKAYEQTLSKFIKEKKAERAAKQE